MNTRTGNYPIGFRQMHFDWHQDLDSLLEWSKEEGVELIDLGRDGDTSVKKVVDAGLQVGSVDFVLWNEMLSPDKAKRSEAVAQNIDYIKTCAEAGAKIFFLAMLPEDPSLPRKENFGFMVDSFGELAPLLESLNAKVVIEGWPGPGALCCTPEGYRAFFEQVPSKSMGVNYDPSHLIRMGIDPHRFLSEFKDRVYHVHGKDCMILQESLYEFGTEQPPTFATLPRWSGTHWRYTVPGHGLSRWPLIVKTLEDNGYQGALSIEMEDNHFSGSDDAEKLGILQGIKFLQGC